MGKIAVLQFPKVMQAALDEVKAFMDLQAKLAKFLDGAWALTLREDGRYVMKAPNPDRTFWQDNYFSLANMLSAYLWQEHRETVKVIKGAVHKEMGNYAVAFTLVFELGGEAPQPVYEIGSELIWLAAGQIVPVEVVGVRRTDPPIVSTPTYFYMVRDLETDKTFKVLEDNLKDD